MLQMVGHVLRRGGMHRGPAVIVPGMELVCGAELNHALHLAGEGRARHRNQRGEDPGNDKIGPAP